MLQVGEILDAIVSETQVYGIYMLARGFKILVLVPELSWDRRISDCREYAHIGDCFRVRILQYDPKNAVFFGSVKQVNPEKNPWYDPSMFAVGCAYQGKIACLLASKGSVSSRSYIVDIAPSVSGILRNVPISQALTVGEYVHVVIASVDPATQKIELILSTDHKSLGDTGSPNLCERSELEAHS